MRETEREVVEVYRVLPIAREDKCNSCPLKGNFPHSVGYEFYGEPPYEYLLVGEAPGNDEISWGRPFIGKSGQLFRQALSEVGISSYILTNVSMCIPVVPGSKVAPPPKEAASYCSSSYLIPFIQRVRPKKVVLLGKTAIEFVLKALLGERFKEGRISDYKKTYFGVEVDGIHYFPLNHPSFVLRRGGVESQEYKTFVGELQSVVEFSHVQVEILSDPVSFSHLFSTGKIPVSPKGRLNYHVFDLDSYEEGFSLIDDLDEVSFDVETSKGETSVDRDLVLVGLGNHEVQVAFDLREGSEENAPGFLQRLREYLDKPGRKVVVYNQSFEAGVYLQLYGEFRSFIDVFSMTKAFGLQTELYQKIGLKKTASVIFGVPEWKDRVLDYVRLAEDMSENLEDWREYLLVSPHSLKQTKIKNIESLLEKLGFDVEEAKRIFSFVLSQPGNPLIGWATVPKEVLARYNAEDVRWTHELYLFYTSLYPWEVWEVYQKQEELGSLMHQVRIRYDVEAAKRLRGEFSRIAVESFREMISSPRLAKEAIEGRLRNLKVRDVPELKEALSLAYRVHLRAYKEATKDESIVEKYKKAYQKLLSSPVLSPEPEPADLSHLVVSKRESLLNSLRERLREEFERDLSMYGKEDGEAWVSRMAAWFNPSSSKAYVSVFHKAISCMPLIAANYIAEVLVKRVPKEDLSLLEEELGPINTWPYKWEEVASKIFGEDWRARIYPAMLQMWESIASGLNDEYMEYLYSLFKDYLGEDLNDYPACLERMPEELAESATLLVSFRMYKKALKVITAYLEGKNGLESVSPSREILWRGIPIPISDSEGDKHYYRTDFFVNSADTKRWRSAFHTIPTGTDLREVYISRWEEEGLWVHFDYSQMELRVLAAISGDENMLDAFKQGLDLHRYVASRIYRIPMEEVSSHQRKIAKGASFSLVYGQTPSGFAMEYTGGDVSEAQRIFDSFFQSFPRVKDYINLYRSMARTYGHVPTIFGDWIDVQRDKPDWERRAQNYPIQSSSSSVAALAGYEISMEALRLGYLAVPLAFTHDALDFDVHAKYLLSFLEIVYRLAREVPMRYGIFADIEVEVGTSFYGGLALHPEGEEDGRKVFGISGKKSVFERVLKRLEKFYEVEVLELSEGEETIPLADIFAPKKALSTLIGKTVPTVSGKIALREVSDES